MYSDAFSWILIGIYLQLNSVFFISFVYIALSLMFIFSIIRTLDYPDYLLKSQGVRVIEARMYLY